MLKKLKDKKKKRGDGGPSTSTSAPGTGWDAGTEEGEELGGEALQNMMADTMDMDMDDDEDGDDNMEIDDDDDEQGEGETPLVASRVEDSPEETEMVVTPIQQLGDAGGVEIKDPRLRVRDTWDLEPQVVEGM